MLRVRNCAATMGPQGIYPASPRPIGISTAQRAGTHSVIKKKKKPLILVQEHPKYDHISYQYEAKMSLVLRKKLIWVENIGMLYGSWLLEVIQLGSLDGITK